MGREERTFDEKRDFYRMAVDCELTYVLTVDGRQGKGICRNLSAGGVAFTTSEALEEGTGLKVRIEPVSSITQPLEALAQVVRCGPDPSGEGHLVAATILEISR
ncbi:MAG: hypothetical protein Kow006_12030 [Gammaproteobacteria bacterium]